MSSETPSPSASPHSSDGECSPPSAANNGKPKKCRFNDCDNLAVDGTSKCAFHKNRRQCCVENCTNQVYARKLCVRHGGKKQCQADNCEAHARGGGFCLQHGGFVVKRFCIVEGCSKQAHARQKCHARAGGLCNRHSHGHECRVDGCNKTAQHSGSICFRHAMELRAHGEEVPELNISKGGRLSSKKRQQQQRDQQMKQEQFHHQQIQQQIHQPHNQQHVPPHPLTITVPSSQSMSQPQQHNVSNPFGLPLKINVPTTMPKFNSLRTPLGNSFPTPRSHEFSLLMGLPSPQIDNSQLPSVLAMTNAGGNATSGGQRTPGFDSSFLVNGPPSISRGNGSSYLSLGLFPTPKLADRTPGGHEEDLDAIINSYSKFMGPDTPMAFHHPNIPGQFGASPMLENINANVFDHANHMNNNRNPIAAMAAAAAVHNTGAQRLKMDFLSPRGLAAHNFESAGYPTTTTTSEGLSSTATLSGSSDYAAQFFADNKNDKTRGAMKSSAVSAATTPTHKPTGVTAA
ncbi:hypothetical protein JM18_006483 [Phytophthora kernoviae]|uniref:Uncharacterized protein n=2 Tax=Phytophthora kernoviae TaxID=325452 RepID=A0A921SB42_9STRA|nr:hypothetical protein G195_007919 [Phytophthora kernoviae 00238/432]KAG2516741.1 hypothetical protein JM18_006483 [Phytophthora kernoviae]